MEEKKETKKWIEVTESGHTIVHLQHPLKPYEGDGADPAMSPSFKLYEKGVRIRPMYAGDTLVCDKGEGEFTKIHALLLQLTSLPKAILNRIHPEDYGRMFAVAQGEMGKFLATLTSARPSSLMSSSGLQESSDE